MRNILLAVFLLAPLASAQKTELGATFGTGASLSAQGAFTTIGVEGCVRCQGRVGYFLEFNRWWLTPPGGQTSVLDFAAGGIRIQGTNKRIRPFLDLGVAAGYYDGHPHDFVHRDEAIGLIGGVLGAGVTVSLPKGFYIRPQVNLAVAPDIGVGFANVGFGYRF
jgi:hypothetical protein